MCTVTFIARKHGYALGMNRDERLTRAKGQSPKVRTQSGIQVVYPSEPSGGTWVALNEFGATLSLINWYSVAARVERDSVSRGEVVRTLCPSRSPSLVATGLNNLPLPRMNPFRLIGIFPADYRITEWRWDQKHLVRHDHPWQTQQWISSGFDESQAQQRRSEVFRRTLFKTPRGGIGCLRRLHRSHAPEIGPFSTCMHRHDAATVSYTEISVSLRTGVMRHCEGSPCQSTPCASIAATLRVVMEPPIMDRELVRAWQSAAIKQAARV